VLEVADRHATPFGRLRMSTARRLEVPMKRYGLTAELRDHPDAAESYERFHADIWPEVRADGRRSGVLRTAIYRDDRRLFMVMDTDDTFEIDAFVSESSSPRVAEWHALMDGLLQDQPHMAAGRKWRVIGLVCDVD
jgi:L-rhamnose mutarotase